MARNRSGIGPKLAILALAALLAAAAWLWPGCAYAPPERKDGPVVLVPQEPGAGIWGAKITERQERERKQAK